MKEESGEQKRASHRAPSRSGLHQDEAVPEEAGCGHRILQHRNHASSPPFVFRSHPNLVHLSFRSSEWGREQEQTEGFGHARNLHDGFPPVHVGLVGLEGSERQADAMSSSLVHRYSSLSLVRRRPFRERVEIGCGDEQPLGGQSREQWQPRRGRFGERAEGR